MPGESTNEHARQFQRHATSFEARIEPHPDHADQFRMSFPDALSGLAVIDVSGGGVGLSSGFYIPKNLRMTLHISGAAADQVVADQLLKIRAVARRCKMIDHKPTYQVGLQFLEADGEDERRLGQAVDESRRERDEAVAAGAEGGS